MHKLIDAYHLKPSDAQQRKIDETVYEILKGIDEKIKLANDEEGRDQVIVNVPIVFNICNMSNSKLQRIIYYKIISSLTDRHFDTKLELTDQFAKFYIKWISKEEEEELIQQNRLLSLSLKK